MSDDPIPIRKEIQLEEKDRKWLDDLQRSGRRAEYTQYLQQVFVKLHIGSEPNVDYTYDFESGIITCEPRMN